MKKRALVGLGLGVGFAVLQFVVLGAAESVYRDSSVQPLRSFILTFETLNAPVEWLGYVWHVVLHLPQWDIVTGGDRGHHNGVGAMGPHWISWGPLVGIQVRIIRKRSRGPCLASCFGGGRSHCCLRTPGLDSFGGFRPSGKARRIKGSP